MDELLEKAVQEIAANHRKIIDDWCKAYMAQLYEEGHDLKPGCFTLNEQRDMVLSNGKIGTRYWFERGVPHYHPEEKLLDDEGITLMNRQEKLMIARQAYKEIREVMSKFEDEKYDFCACWDECISVDDELFHGPELSLDN